MAERQGEWLDRIGTVGKYVVRLRAPSGNEVTEVIFAANKEAAHAQALAMIDQGERYRRHVLLKIEVLPDYIEGPEPQPAQAAPRDEITATEPVAERDAQSIVRKLAPLMPPRMGTSRRYQVVVELQERPEPFKLLLTSDSVERARAQVEKLYLGRCRVLSVACVEEFATSTADAPAAAAVARASRAAAPKGVDNKGTDNNIVPLIARAFMKSG